LKIVDFFESRKYWVFFVGNFFLNLRNFGRLRLHGLVGVKVLRGWLIFTNRNLYFRELLRMRREEDLFWGLPEFRNLGFEGQFLHGVLKNLNVNLALVSDWVEHVVVIDRALLGAKY